MITNVDPFAKEIPNTIVCSRNGMKHVLKRDTSLDKYNIHGYADENGRSWLCLKDGKIIYSKLCLLTTQIGVENLADKQPTLANVKALCGTYHDKDPLQEHPYFTFSEDKGHLHMSVNNDSKCYPCLFIPNEGQGGMGHE